MWGPGRYFSWKDIPVLATIDVPKLLNDLSTSIALYLLTASVVVRRVSNGL